MKIDIISAMYGRHDTVKQAVESWQETAINIHMMASTDEDLELCDKLGINSYYAPNKPLSNKWQKGIDILKENSKADAIIILGSDDIVKDFTRYYELLAEGYEYISLGEIYFKDLATQTYKHWKGYTCSRKGESAGAGRCLSRSLLDKLNWKLWEPGLTRSLDGCLTEKLKKIHHKNILLTSEDVVLIDLKDEGSLTSWTAFNLPVIKNIDL